MHRSLVGGYSQPIFNIVSMNHKHFVIEGDQTFRRWNIFIESLHNFVPNFIKFSNNVTSDTRSNGDFMMRMSVNRSKGKLGLHCLGFTVQRVIWKSRERGSHLCNCIFKRQNIIRLSPYIIDCLLSSQHDHPFGYCRDLEWFIGILEMRWNK